ncbi:MAG TPA: hypothetical protein ENL27_00455 [Candidatus Parcubacteria bacterium]|nr:hypothetical protein [Candidatus Parcubacteria bacterium]
MERSIILPRLGKKIGDLKGFEKIGPKKRGERVIIPVKGEKVSEEFGSDKYLIIDLKNKKIAFKEIFTNPYFEENSPHGARFTKAIRADKILVRNIGENAKKSLENFGIEVIIVPREKSLKDVLDEIENEKES